LASAAGGYVYGAKVRATRSATDYMARVSHIIPVWLFPSEPLESMAALIVL